MARPSQYTASEHEEANSEMEKRPPAQHGARSFDLEALVALLRDTVIFFGIISYFVGWIYLNEYLRQFGLYLANLEIPIHYVFVFSYAPLLDVLYEPTFSGVMKLIFLLVLIFGCIAAYRSSQIVRYPVILVGFLFILLISFQTAREAGRLHAFKVLNGDGKAIRFVFKPSITGNSDHAMLRGLIRSNSRDTACLRLVWQTAETVYAVDWCDVRKPTYRIPMASSLIWETYPAAREK